jgi:hypothetical protein
MKHRDQIERLAAERIAAIRTERDRLQREMMRLATGGVLLFAAMALFLLLALLAGCRL